jgi:DDE superfamily endonuclease
VLLAEDETDLLLFPPLRSCWALRGQPAYVPLSGRNARRVIFGALNLRTGHRLLLPREHQRAVDFQAFLRFVHNHYRGWRVTWLLDEDSSHTAFSSQQLAERLSMKMIWLPKRSPELNPLDHLWGHGKDAICANRQYETIESQVARFIDYITSLSNTDALRKAGILSGGFWLANVMSKDFCGPA